MILLSNNPHDVWIIITLHVTEILYISNIWCSKNIVYVKYAY